MASPVSESLPTRAMNALSGVKNTAVQYGSRAVEVVKSNGSNLISAIVRLAKQAFGLVKDYGSSAFTASKYYLGQLRNYSPEMKWLGAGALVATAGLALWGRAFGTAGSGAAAV